MGLITSGHAWQQFSYTGGPQLYVVPEGVTQLDVELCGGEGATYPGAGLGGKGGGTTATISVTPGESLQINVGGYGQNNAGTFNGGARGAGGGGGASDIRRPAMPYDPSAPNCAFELACGNENRIVVAAGGGGGGTPRMNGLRADGGMGGYPAGAPGTAATRTVDGIYIGDARAGGGGTQTGGGAFGGGFQSGGFAAGWGGGFGDGGGGGFVPGASSGAGGE